MPAPLTMVEDLRRIAFVTARFEELQGLRTASLGAGLIVGVVLLSHAGPAQLDPSYILLALLIGNSLNLYWLEGYYRETFGQATDPDERWRTLVAHPMIALMLGTVIDMVRLTIKVAWGPSAASVALLGTALWILVRDWPRRPHYAVAAVAGVVAIIVSISAPQKYAFALDVTTRNAYAAAHAIVGLALFGVGLFDHRLLGLSLSTRRASSARDTSLAGAMPGLSRAMTGAGLLAALLTFGLVTGWPIPSPWIFHAGLFGWLGGDLLLLWRVRARLRVRLAGGRIEDDFEGGSTSPRPQLAAHLLLPLAVASGVLLDIVLRGTGVPSLACAALAMSHLWIVIRDWPFRRHYIFGALAATVMSIAYMFAGASQQPLWVTTALAVFGASLTFEGTMDYRLVKQRRANASAPEGSHVDAI